MPSNKFNPSLLLPTGVEVEHNHGRNDSFSSTISNDNVKAINKTKPFLQVPSVSTEVPAADVYPYEGTNIEKLKHEKGYRTVKVVHWIRHAQGYHNIGGEKAAKSRRNIDARLTPHGRQQCQELANAIHNAPVGSRLGNVREKAQLIVTSPVTRCVETALISLEPVIEGNPDIPILANEAIRETVNFNCDRRRPIHEIATDFPQVDFTQACPSDEDAIWLYYEQMLGGDHEYTEEREQAEIHVIADRTRQFFEWLGKEREEDNIIVCCHATVSRCMFNYGHPGKTATDVPQKLDRRGPQAEDIPVISYASCNANVDPSYIREDFKNCELRSMVVAYR